MNFDFLNFLRLRKPQAVAELKAQAPTLAPVDTSRGWFPLIHEPYTGAWQRNDALTVDTQLSFYAVYACISRIAGDLGKLRPRVMFKDPGGIWVEDDASPLGATLRRPNNFQNHIQFKENWATSKLTRGNTYALLERDTRSAIVRQHLLGPNRVKPLVAPDGSVFYQLRPDNLAGLGADVTVPASEIIHDRMNCLFHPLMGVSPLYACGLAAGHGITIQRAQSNFFANGSNPGGMLLAPGHISQDTADRLKEQWQDRYTGSNVGRVAVLGDGLKYEPMMMTATDAQLIEQLKITGEMACAAFNMPAFKVGIGAMPTFQNGEILNQIYYSDCLQLHIEQFELCQDNGMGIGAGVRVDGLQRCVNLDLDGLLRMDSATQMKALVDGVAGAIVTPNEARRRLNLKPLPGGDTVYMQQQNWSLEQLSARSAPTDGPR
jgi:HK97 family phage portal protein